MVKKAYMITLEAIIAIVILYVFTTYALSRSIQTPKPTLPDDIEIIQDTIFSQIQAQDYYRTCAIQSDYQCINNLINSSIKPSLSYNFSVCHEAICPVFILGQPKDVYTKSIIISTNTTNYNTTLVTVHLWRNI